MGDVESEFAQAFEQGGGALPEPPAAGPAPAEPAAPPGGTIDPSGRLRDAETGAYTTPEKLERKWADRFDTPEEMEASWTDLNSKVGSMANEVGQWRQLGQMLQQQAAQQQARPVQPSELDAWDEAALEDPRGTAMKALRTGNPELVERVMDTWYDQRPREAMHFEMELRLRHQEQQFEQRRSQELAPHQAQLSQQSFAAAIFQTKQQYPDFEETTFGNEQVLGEAVRILGGDAFVRGLNETPDAGEKQRALVALYTVARGLNGGAPNPNPLASRLQATVAAPGSIPTGTGRSTASQSFHDLWEQGVASLTG